MRDVFIVGETSGRDVGSGEYQSGKKDRRESGSNTERQEVRVRRNNHVGERC